MNKKLNIITILFWILLVSAFIAFGFWLGIKADAELSDEILKEVEKLRRKHSPFIYVNDDTLYYRPEEYRWTSIWIEDGKLFVEAQDGKWYIEMKEIE